MDNLPENKNLPKGMLNVQGKQFSSQIVILALIIITLTVVGYYWTEKKKDQVSSPNLTPQALPRPFSGIIINVKNGELPENLPPDIVKEKDVQVLQSYYTRPFPYNNELTVFQVQSSFRFVSKKEPNENFILYSKYLKDNGWKIIDSKDKKDIKKLTAIKGPDQLNITISPSPATKETIVGLFNIHIGLYSELNKKIQ